MKAIVSSTHDDMYLFFLPIITWCWNKLGVDVICFMPEFISNPIAPDIVDKINIIWNACRTINGKIEFAHFKCPEHKEATYAQCSRLYAAALDLPENEMLITSDVDMTVFKIPISQFIGDRISVLGFDLVPEGQMPMCYAAGTVKEWRTVFEINESDFNSSYDDFLYRKDRTYQKCLDDLLGNIECDHFRGNYWSRDQEELNNKIIASNSYMLLPRARPNTQFAANRLDRDDAYLLERLNPDIIDYHMPRPGYEENNFNQILTVLQYFYPTDNFDWLINYRKEYIKLL